MRLNKIRLPKDKSLRSEVFCLHDDYWKNNTDKISNVTSSHWKFWSEKTVLTADQTSDFVNFRGAGFGDFRNKMFAPLFAISPVNYFLTQMMKPLPKTFINALYEVCLEHNREVSFDCVKQVLSVNRIIESEVNFSGKRVCVIGDGYGFLGCFIKKIFPNVNIVSINLGKILFFDFLLSVQKNENSTFNYVSSENNYDDCADFNFVPAEIIFKTGIDDIDIFFNIASMQEMNIETVNQYFSFIRAQSRRKKYFYCCNRLSKTLPAGNIIKFDDYDWKDSDKILFDELCEWYQIYPKNRPPFRGRFDGRIWHKFIEI